MRILHLVRHGPVVVDSSLHSSEWNLAPAAEESVAVLATRLRQIAPGRLLSSHHNKAIQTAGILSDALNVPLEVRQGLEEHHRENGHFFATSALFQRAMAEFFARREEIVFGTESASTALQRLHRAICEIAAETDDPEIIVTHGAVIALLLEQGGNGDAFSIWENLQQPDYIKIEWPSLKSVDD